MALSKSRSDKSGCAACVSQAIRIKQSNEFSAIYFLGLRLLVEGPRSFLTSHCKCYSKLVNCSRDRKTKLKSVKHSLGQHCFKEKI